MSLFGKRLWDDDSFLLDHLRPRHAAVDLGTLEHPLRDLHLSGAANVAGGLALTGDLDLTGDLELTGDLNQTGNLDLTGDLDVSGDTNLLGILGLNEAADGRQGVATLVAGTVTVANTSITANTRILLSRTTTGGTEGHLSSVQTAGVDFTINSSDAADTSDVLYVLLEPAA